MPGSAGVFPRQRSLSVTLHSKLALAWPVTSGRRQAAATSAQLGYTIMIHAFACLCRAWAAYLFLHVSLCGGGDHFMGPPPVGASMFDFIREGTTNDVLATLELVGTDPFDHSEVASFQLTSEGAALGPLGLLGTDRIPGPFSSSVNRFTADGDRWPRERCLVAAVNADLRGNDVCRHELHVSAGPVGMSDAIGLDSAVCDTPSILVHGTWHVAPESTLGDVNLDGDVNGLDVDPFVEVLLNGPYRPEADMNDDEESTGSMSTPSWLLWAAAVRRNPRTLDPPPQPRRTGPSRRMAEVAGVIAASVPSSALEDAPAASVRA